MPGGAVITGTADTSRIEAPVTVKAYLICAFAAFGGIFFGYDTGVCIFSPPQLLEPRFRVVGILAWTSPADVIVLRILHSQVGFLRSFNYVPFFKSALWFGIWTPFIKSIVLKRGPVHAWCRRPSGHVFYVLPAVSRISLIESRVSTYLC